jgi:hypothetical protein
MNDDVRDSELRARFDVLKRIDAGRAPAFADVMARARSELAHTTPATTRHEWGLVARRYGWLGGLAAAATIVALIALPRRESQEAAFERAVRSFHSDSALGAWRSPTDGLLDLPGSRLIATTPSISTIR